MNSKSEYNRSLLPSIRTNDSKTPWEQSDLSEEEVKEGMKALKRNGSKLKWSLKLCENDNESLIGSLHGENENESLTGSRNNEDITLARFDQNVLCENVNGSLTVPLQVENESRSKNLLDEVPEYEKEGLTLPLPNENEIGGQFELNNLNNLTYVRKLNSVHVSRSQSGIENLTNILRIDGSGIGMDPVRSEQKSPEIIPNKVNDTIENPKTN